MACNEEIKHCDRRTKVPSRHTDRGLQCQLALEPALQELVERAAESGWTDDEIAYAPGPEQQDEHHTATPPNLLRPQSPTMRSDALVSPFGNHWLC